MPPVQNHGLVCRLVFALEGSACSVRAEEAHAHHPGTGVGAATVGARRYSRAMTARDLELVLLTGAGASCPLGVGGKALPLMQDWSNHVVQKLSSLGSDGYAMLKASGLSENLGGYEFEDRLGTFLRAVGAFEQIGPLVEPSLDFMSVPGSIKGQGELGRWYYAVTEQLKKAVSAVHASLYDLFGDPLVDLDAASAAYGGLLAQLGISAGSRWVYATTNYDTIGERVIRRLGGRPPDWGELPSLDSTGEKQLDVRNIVDGVGRFVPVLHLHGRIGWHQRSADQGGYVYASQTKSWMDGIGAPVVMLPDPKKLYDEHDVIFELWRQFKIALGRAQRVFVLGHSLNDPAIVEALRAVEPARVAVAVLAKVGGVPEVDPAAEQVLDLLRRELPGVTSFPLIFGQRLSPQVSTAIARWNEGVARLANEADTAVGPRAPS
jgi:hypothetical protein